MNARVLLAAGLLASAAVAYGAEKAPDIVALIETNNKAEVKAGREALERTLNPDVREFANMMVDHHKKSAKDIKKADLDVDKTERSKSAAKEAEAKFEQLQDLKGAAFDRAYMDHQVLAHETLLGEIDKALEDKDALGEAAPLVEKTRGVVETHLEEAKKIRDGLKD